MHLRVHPSVRGRKQDVVSLSLWNDEESLFTFAPAPPSLPFLSVCLSVRPPVRPSAVGAQGIIRSGTDLCWALRRPTRDQFQTDHLDNTILSHLRVASLHFGICFLIPIPTETRENRGCSCRRRCSSSALRLPPSALPSPLMHIHHAALFW